MPVFDSNTSLNIECLHSISHPFGKIAQFNLFPRHNKISQAGQLKQQKFISPHSGGWKPQIKVLAEPVLLPRCWWCLLTVSSHGGERARSVYWIRASPLWPHLTLLTSWKPYHQTQSHCSGLGLQSMNLVCVCGGGAASLPQPVWHEVSGFLTFLLVFLKCKGTIALSPIHKLNSARWPF